MARVGAVRSLPGAAQTDCGRMNSKYPDAFRFAFIGCLCLGLATVVLAAQDDDLKRVGSNTWLAGRLAGVGRVFSGAGASISIATGFLVSSCHVLTAGHLLARGGEHVQLGAEVRFFVGNGRERKAADWPVRGRVVAASRNFTMPVDPVGFDQKLIPNDWALIELEHTITEIEPIRLMYQWAPNSMENTYTVAGYTQGLLGLRLYAQEHCAGMRSPHGGIELKDILIADCAVRAGMSGGPMLLDDGKRLVAAGMVVKRFTVGEKIMAVGVPVSAFAEQINEVMRASEVCSVGQLFVWPASKHAD